jgi:hypothetical protein
MDIARLKFAIDDWSQVVPASDDQTAAFLPEFHRFQGFTGSTRLTIREEMAPADVFLCLLGEFGEPNGVLSEIRKQGDAVKAEILWHYMLSWRGRLIHLVAHPYRIEVVFSTEGPVDLTAAGFVGVLRAWMSRNGQKLAAAKKQITHWHSFLNPLQHMADACERMLYRARILDAGLAKSREQPVTPAEIAWHEANLQPHALAAAELASCCLAVRMMAPVLGEMFVNLIIHNQYRGDIPKVRDKSHYASASILVRLERMHRECNGFARAVDMDNQAIRGYLAVMNHRNDLLHGNVRPADRKEDELLLYQGIPLPKKYRSVYDRSIGPILNAFPLAEAEDDLHATRGLIDYLLGCLEPDVAETFRPMLESLDLHQERNQSRLTALYTNIAVGPQALENLYRHVAS